jgi:hypothetical protein
MRRAATPSSATRASSATYSGRVRFLAAGFFCVFVAYSSAQLLQTALNGARGYACLFAVYAAFGLCSLYAPALVSRFGPNALLPGSACGYAIMVAANLFRGEAAAGLLVPSCVFVGACAATLWSAQAVYLGKASLELSTSEGRELTLCTSELNSAFYSTFMASGVVSGLFSSAVMMSGVPDAVSLLFLLLTGVGVAGVVAFALLPEAGDPSSRVFALPGTKHGGAALLVVAEAEAAAAASVAESWWREEEAPAPAVLVAASAAEVAQVKPEFQHATAATLSTATAPSAPAASAAAASTAAAADPPVRPTLLYMVVFLATDRRMRYIIPTIFATGFGAGFVNGAWMGGVVARRIGTPLVGLIGATYAAASSLASRFLWAPLAQRPAFGRRWSFAYALAAYVIWYIGFAAYIAATPADGASADLPVLFLGAIAHGLFDPVLSSFVPATLQTFFSGGRDALCAMSSVRVIYSAGFAGAQLLSTSLSAAGASPRYAEQSALAAALTLLAAGCLSWLHLRVCEIDVVKAEGKEGSGHLAAKVPADEGAGPGAGVVDAAGAMGATHTGAAAEK